MSQCIKIFASSLFKPCSSHQSPRPPARPPSDPTRKWTCNEGLSRATACIITKYHAYLAAPAAPQCAVPVTQIVIEPSLSFGSIVLHSHLSLPQKCCQKWGRPLINPPSFSCGSCSDKDSNVLPSPCPLMLQLSTLHCRESKVRT